VVLVEIRHFKCDAMCLSVGVGSPCSRLQMSRREYHDTCPVHRNMEASMAIAPVHNTRRFERSKRATLIP